MGKDVQSYQIWYLGSPTRLRPSPVRCSNHQRNITFLIPIFYLPRLDPSLFHQSLTTQQLNRFDRCTVVPFIITIPANFDNLVLKITEPEKAPGLDEIINRIGELAASLVRINLPEKGSDAELNTYETITEKFYISSAIGGLVQGGLEISRKRNPKLLAAGVILDFGGVLGAFATAIMQRK
jgi:hypothetical protein